MTKPMNTIERKTQRRVVALHNMEQGDCKNHYFGREKQIAVLRERIAIAPDGKVSTKKNRSDKVRKGQD